MLPASCPVGPSIKWRRQGLRRTHPRTHQAGHVYALALLPSHLLHLFASLPGHLMHIHSGRRPRCNLTRFKSFGRATTKRWHWNERRMEPCV
ncbi:hypothetical protein LY78DRAFT_89709 [Colletotrichum sublineola]|nr:hypothetical protein LY78DRAFT_89709 [Colletotrichum sublineola]